MIIEAFTGRPVTDTLRIINELTLSVIDAEDLVERKAAAKARRVKRIKKQNAGNLAAAKAAAKMKAERNGSEQHRPVERPSVT